MAHVVNDILTSKLTSGPDLLASFNRGGKKSVASATQSISKTKESFKQSFESKKSSYNDKKEKIEFKAGLSLSKAKEQVLPGKSAKSGEAKGLAENVLQNEKLGSDLVSGESLDVVDGALVANANEENKTAQIAQIEEAVEAVTIAAKEGGLQESVEVASNVKEEGFEANDITSRLTNSFEKADSQKQDPALIVKEQPNNLFDVEVYEDAKKYFEKPVKEISLPEIKEKAKGNIEQVKQIDVAFYEKEIEVKAPFIGENIEKPINNVEVAKAGEPLVKQAGLFGNKKSQINLTNNSADLDKEIEELKALSSQLNEEGEELENVLTKKSVTKKDLPNAKEEASLKHSISIQISKDSLDGKVLESKDAKNAAILSEGQDKVGGKRDSLTKASPDGVLLNKGSEAKPVSSNDGNNAAALTAEKAEGAPRTPQLNLKSESVHRFGDAKDVMAQIKFGFGQMSAKGEKHISIQLYPRELGSVDVQMKIANDGKTHLTIMAEKTDTLNLLQKEASSLRDMLQDALKTENTNLSFTFKEEQNHNWQNEQGGFSSASYGNEIDEESSDVSYSNNYFVDFNSFEPGGINIIA